MSANLINIIFGMKVRQARVEAGLTLSELAAQSEMSPSYLTEIEKGRKYPRANKIMSMAAVLGKPYDSLVSIQLDPSWGYLESALTSPLLQNFPFEEFGMELTDLVQLLTQAPDQMSALLHAIGEIGRLYDMQEEHLLRAILRSYQELRDNYFPDLEEAATELIKTHGWDKSVITIKQLKSILADNYKYSVSHNLTERDATLAHYRSVTLRGRSPHIVLNDALMPRQVKFQLAREIAHQRLGIKERSFTSPPDRVNSFQQAINDFRASYVAGALLMPSAAILKDLQHFFDQPTWQPELLQEMLVRYDVTPEMLLYRFSELIPQFFGLNLHFLRMHQGVDQKYRLVKQLNMNRLLIPSGAGLHEHHCRRWLTTRLLQQMTPETTAENPHVGVQMSEFIQSGERYFCIGFGRPLTMQDQVNSSVIVGFQVDADFLSTVRFAEHQDIPLELIHETCERCHLTPAQCSERAVPPTHWLKIQEESKRQEALRNLKERGRG